jgi:hypothetical protein
MEAITIMRTLCSHNITLLKLSLVVGLLMERQRQSLSLDKASIPTLTPNAVSTIPFQSPSLLNGIKFNVLFLQLTKAKITSEKLTLQLHQMEKTGISLMEASSITPNL